MSRMVIDLPWPDKKLSSNSRGGWRSKESSRKEAVAFGMMLARVTDHNGVNLHKELTLSILVCPPDKRKRDILNVVDSLKHWIDGVCRGKQFDDSRIKRVVADWGETYPDGRVVLTFEEKA